MAQDKYIIGKGRAPEWCRRFLTPYINMRGGISYHFYGKFRDYELEVGDILTKENSEIKVKKGRGHELGT